jgi:hypothetical protein
VYIENFIRDYIEGNFYKKIYQEIPSGKQEYKSHFEIVFENRTKLLEKWKSEESEEFIREIPSKNDDKKYPFTITRSKNPLDIFMIGTETKSCQDVNGGGIFNKCLMGYILDPCIQAIMIKRQSDGMIVARALLRMLWNPEKKHPVLLLEKTYCNDNAPRGYGKSIENYAKKVAQEMVLPLVGYQTTNQKAPLYNYELVSNDGGKAPFQYVDASDIGISSGKFRLTKYSNILFEPQFEPKCANSIIDRLQEKTVKKEHKNEERKIFEI